MIQEYDAIRISRVDHDKHIVYMTVNGHPVTAVCTSESDPDVYSNVKRILVNSVSKNIAKIHEKT